MSAIVLIVDFTFNPGQRDAFIARVQEHRKNVLANEPGCKQFDLVIPDDAPDKAFLYEIYQDEAAHEFHMGTAYMAEYRADTGPMIAERILTKGRIDNG